MSQGLIVMLLIVVALAILIFGKGWRKSTRARHDRAADAARQAVLARLGTPESSPDASTPTPPHRNSAQFNSTGGPDGHVLPQSGPHPAGRRHDDALPDDKRGAGAKPEPDGERGTDADSADAGGSADGGGGGAD